MNAREKGITAKVHLDRPKQCSLTKPLKLKNMKLQKEGAFGVQGTYH